MHVVCTRLSYTAEVLSERLQEAQSQLLEQQVTQDALQQTVEEKEQQVCPPDHAGIMSLLMPTCLDTTHRSTSSTQ